MSLCMKQAGCENVCVKVSCVKAVDVKTSRHRRKENHPKLISLSFPSLLAHLTKEMADVFGDLFGPKANYPVAEPEPFTLQERCLHQAPEVAGDHQVDPDSDPEWKKFPLDEGKSPNTLPWPKINHFYVANSLLNHLNAGTKACVMEKLDGSNLLITSDGRLYSRRVLVMQQPTEKKLKHKKFSTLSMEQLWQPMLQCRKLKETVAAWFDVEVEVLVYGEFILEWTSAGKEDV